jgi:hypothetical protein
VENAMREVTLQIEDYQKRLKKDRDDRSTPRATPSRG